MLYLTFLKATSIKEGVVSYKCDLSKKWARPNSIPSSEIQYVSALSFKQQGWKEGEREREKERERNLKNQFLPKKFKKIELPIFCFLMIIFT